MPFGRNNIVYTGFIDVAVEFDLTLQGVPTGEIMDEAQQIFFEKQVRNFLTSSLYDGGQVLDVEITEQAPLSSRRGLQRLGDERRVADNREIFGMQLAYISEIGFRENIERAFLNHQDDFLSGVAFGLLLPGEVAEGVEKQFFTSLSSAEVSSVYLVIPPSSLTAAPSPQPTNVDGETSDGSEFGGYVGDGIDSGGGIINKAAGDANFIEIAVGVTVGGLVVYMLVLFTCRHIKRKKTETRETEERRKTRRKVKASRASAKNTPPPERAPVQKLKKAVPVLVYPESKDKKALTRKQSSSFGKHERERPESTPSDQNTPTRSRDRSAHSNDSRSQERSAQAVPHTSAQKGASSAAHQDS